MTVRKWTKKRTIPVININYLFIQINNDHNNETKKDEHAGHDMESKKDSSAAAPATSENVTTITPSFTNVDTKVTAGLGEILQHYYHIQFALTNDDATEAGNGGKMMADAIAKVDKSAMTADQKTLYEKNEEDLKEHAEHISKSKIDHQREHFEKMSEDVYDLVKGFGAGKPVYKTFCPMAFNNKGAYWISTGMEVKNPYFGKEMLTCGKVQEVIK
jgi:vacuolar-type H+-ATPase catalytic subunit A/Vma1